MKNSLRCPKCQGAEIAHAPGGKLNGQSNVQFGNFMFPTTIRLSHYICKTCGFAELWVDGQDDFADLQQMESITS